MFYRPVNVWKHASDCVQQDTKATTHLLDVDHNPAWVSLMSQTGRKVGWIESINTADIWAAERTFTPSVCLLLLICERYGTETNKIKLNNPQSWWKRENLQWETHRFHWPKRKNIREILRQLFKHTFITQMNEWTWLATVVLHQILIVGFCKRLLVSDVCCSFIRVVTLFALFVTPSLISARWLQTDSLHHTITTHRFECFLKYCLLGFFFHEASPSSLQGQIEVLECICPRHSTGKNMGPHNKSQLYIFERLVCCFRKTRDFFLVWSGRFTEETKTRTSWG